MSASESVSLFRVRCLTESVWYEVWSPTDTTPTVCPVNAAHTIDPSLTSIIRSVAAGETTAFVSTKNSTTTPLGANGVFTGDSEEATQAATLSIYVTTDHKSAKDGLLVQFSSDGLAWQTNEKHTIKANVAYSTDLTVVSQFFRIVYTNGPVAQTTFKLQTILHPTRNRPAAIPLSSTVDVALGRVPGSSYVFFSGQDRQLGTTPKTVWAHNVEYVFAASASVMTVTSTSANDTFGGSGAHIVQITYLDANYVQQIENVVMNGTTGTASVGSILRINDIRVAIAGSSMFNEGTIYVGTGAILAGVPANVYAVVDSEDGVMKNGIFTVPEDKNLKIMFAQASVQSLGVLVSLEFRIRFFGTNSWQTISTLSIKDGIWTSDYSASPPLPARTDICIRGTTLGVAITTHTCFSLMVLLTDEP